MWIFRINNNSLFSYFQRDWREIVLGGERCLLGYLDFNVWFFFLLKMLPHQFLLITLFELSGESLYHAHKKRVKQESSIPSDNTVVFDWVALVWPHSALPNMYNTNGWEIDLIYSCSITGGWTPSARLSPNSFRQRQPILII